MPAAFAEYRRFDGGLNLRDAPSELAENETPACFNVTLDERGGVSARLGLAKLNGSSLLPAAPQYLYYSSVADALLAYISTDAGVGKLYKSTDGGVTWSSAYALFTAGASGAIVDFKNRVVVVNTIDGVYSFPAGLAAPTHTAGGTNNMEAVRGSAVASWQNKLWVCGDPNNKPRVWRCAIGDELTWTIATDWTDIREVDDNILTGIGAGQGVDFTSKPTLIICKQNSTYRINDSSTGAFTTLHAQGAGAASAQSIASSLGRICFINDRGVWVTDGPSIPVRVSDKIGPLFSPDGLNLAALAGWTAGVQRDRIVFNVARNGSSTNNLQLEYHPQVGWFTAHKGMNLGPMALYTKNTRKLIGADVAAGKIYEVGKSGTDDGTAIACFWQTRWQEMNQGAEARLRRIRVWGRGNFDAYVKTDFTRGAGDQFNFDFATATDAFVWGAGVWGFDDWGDAQYESALDEPLDEVGKYMSLLISKSVTTSSSGPPLLTDGVAPEVGAFGFYQIRLDYVPLGAA
jgi:hypothetical protein